MLLKPPKLPKLPDYYIDNIVRTAICEDINYIDTTADLLFGDGDIATVNMLAKEDGVLSGIDIAESVFKFVDNETVIEKMFNDGDEFKKGDTIAVINGKTASLLKSERVALNLLQHMCGIAAYTKRCVDMIKGTNSIIVDTRKTLPGLRGIQKYAVLCGGGKNHRYNLSSAAMIKDNHIDAYGGIQNAVNALKNSLGHMVPIEVEVRTLPQLREAINAGANIILLDNMTVDEMGEAVKIAKNINTNIKLEASGNITENTIRKVAKTGVDIISIGALTHSVTALDISIVWGK